MVPTWANRESAASNASSVIASLSGQLRLAKLHRSTQQSVFPPFFFAHMAYCGPTITATRWRTRSAIRDGRRSYWPSSRCYSTVTFCPSTFAEAFAEPAEPAEASADPPLTSSNRHRRLWPRRHAPAPCDKLPPASVISRADWDSLSRGKRGRRLCFAASSEGPGLFPRSSF